MAQNLVLNILAKDKTRQAFAGVRSGLANLKSAVFSVQSALVGIGGGLVVKSILDEKEISFKALNDYFNELETKK